jgi:hypothetical protein
MRAAASAWAAAPGGSIIVTNIVMDLTTFERQLRRVADTDPGPDDRPSTGLADDAAALEPLDLDPSDDQDGSDGVGSDEPDPPGGSAGEPSADLEPVPETPADIEPALEPDPEPETWDPWAPLPEPFPPERTRSARGEPPRAPGPADPRNGTRFACRTLDGKPLDPAEVTAQALLGHVRRVVIGSNGVVLDMGRRSRLFTGLRQLAIRLPELTCTHPGCTVPVSHCQSDHLDAYNGPRHGTTDPGNGAPTCGTHNRHKETHRITPRRDEHGRWHHYRPDGTEIPRPGDP